MQHPAPPLAAKSAMCAARRAAHTHAERLLAVRYVLYQIGIFAACLLASDIKLYGLLRPCALGFALATSDDDSIAALLGAGVGALLFLPFEGAVVRIVTLAILALVRWLFAARASLAFIAACSALPCVTLVCAMAGVVTLDWVLLALADAALAGALGWYLRRCPPTETAQGACALLCIALVGVSGLALPYCWVAVVVASLFCTVLAYRGAQEPALWGAMAVSLALSVGNETFLFVGVGLCAASLAAVRFGAGEKAQTSLVYLGASLLGAFAATYGAADFWDVQTLAGICYIGIVGCSLLIFLVMPQQWLCGARYEASVQSAQLRPHFSIAGAQLGAVAQGLSDIADTVNDVYRVLPRGGDNFNWVIERTQESLCNNCTRREECWMRRYQETVYALFALQPILQETEHVRVEQFSAGLSHCIHPAALASELTRAYALYRSKTEARVRADALRSALSEQYGAVAAALEGLSEQLGKPGTPDLEKTRRVAAYFTEREMPPLECAVTRQTQGSLRAAITLPRTGFTQEELCTLASAVARICARPIAPPQKLSCRGVTTLIFYEKPTLRPVFGVSYRAAKGNITGDAVQQFCRARSAEMILCDGMGTGCPAAVDGNLAAELTARLLKASFSAQTAARLVNVALSLKSDDESGATLDLISVDLYTGAANLFKAGAAPGFIVQGGAAKAIGADSLPIGVLESVQGSSLFVRLSAGDYAVLVSDGMLLDGMDWILQQLALSAASAQTPQEIADLLVSAAHLRARSHGRADDITAAVMRLERC